MTMDSHRILLSGGMTMDWTPDKYYCRNERMGYQPLRPHRHL